MSGHSIDNLFIVLEYHNIRKFPACHQCLQFLFSFIPARKYFQLHTGLLLQDIRPPALFHTGCIGGHGKDLQCYDVFFRILFLHGCLRIAAFLCLCGLTTAGKTVHEQACCQNCCNYFSKPHFKSSSLFRIRFNRIPYKISPSLPQS